MSLRIKSGADFKSALTQIALKLQKDMTRVNKKLALDAFNSLVAESPVDTGLLRHNWDVSIDKEPEEEQ